VKLSAYLLKSALVAALGAALPFPRRRRPVKTRKRRPPGGCSSDVPPGSSPSGARILRPTAGALELAWDARSGIVEGAKAAPRPLFPGVTKEFMTPSGAFDTRMGGQGPQAEA